MEALLSRPLDAIYRLCIWAAGGAIACMSLIVPWGIFTRYVLGSGSAWPEPIALAMRAYRYADAMLAERAKGGAK